MKKLLALLLTGAMVFSVAACGGSEPAADAPAEASTELNIYMWQQYISDELIANFEAENNCTVNLSYMSDNADAINKLTAGGGEEYDLIIPDHAWETPQVRQMIATMKTEEFKEKILALGGYTVENPGEIIEV